MYMVLCIKQNRVIETEYAKYNKNCSLCTVMFNVLPYLPIEYEHCLYKTVMLGIAVFNLLTVFSDTRIIRMK